MFNQKLIPPILTGIVFLLILLWTYTASSKFLDYDRFVFQLSLVPFWPIYQTASIIAITIPILESVLAILLIKEKWRFYGVLYSMLLLICFEFYIGLLLVISPHLPCTCGGIISTMGWKSHLVFNAVLILCCAYYIYETKINTKNKALKTACDVT